MVIFLCESGPADFRPDYPFTLTPYMSESSRKRQNFHILFNVYIPHALL